MGESLIDRLKKLGKWAVDAGLPGYVLGKAIQSSARSLTNPDIRVPLPDDFPPVVNYRMGLNLLEALEEQLTKRDETLESVGTITVAYPHKNPEVFKGYKDSAEGIGENIKRVLRKAYEDRERAINGEPEKRFALPFEIQVADAICENVRLGRSENQSSLHALTGRQVFDVAEQAQMTPLDFINPEKQDRSHYFILADVAVEQGTTLANLASYITHNGGDVLLATGAYIVEKNIKPKDDLTPRHIEVNLSGKFAEAGHKQTLVDVGQALVRAARREGKAIHLDRVLEMVEEGLNRNGNSLLAITTLEASRLVESLDSGNLSFKAVVAAKPVRGHAYDPLRDR